MTIPIPETCPICRRDLNYEIDKPRDMMIANCECGAEIKLTLERKTPPTPREEFFNDVEIMEYAERLIGCPICAGKATITMHQTNDACPYRAHCEDGCVTTQLFDTLDELVDHWNTRRYKPA